MKSMISKHHQALIVCCVILSVCISCEKTAPDVSSRLPVVYNTPPGLTNTAPTAEAGDDIQLVWPADSCVLIGSAFDNESNIKSVQWQKLSGPASYHLENQHSLSTKLSNLQKGVYEFELTVTDEGGLVGRDRIFVNVIEISGSTNEVIFYNQNWSCPWGCSLLIENIYSFIPAGTPVSVYIKRDNTSIWEQATPSDPWPSSYRYVYSIDNGTLWLYSDYDEYDTPDVKIIY